MAIDKIFNDANVDGIADNIFGAVNNSVSEVKAMQQRKAAENVQLVVEAFKKIETNITEKFDNVTDVIEKRVLTIKDGRDGSSGSDGRNGRDGKPGRDGVNGKQGPPGTPGKDGVDGEDGVSVTNANIDFDGSLVISLSTGQQINVGEVVAPDLAEKIKIVSTMSTNGAVGIKDEGSSISTGVKNINFVGATVTATASGDDVTVNVSAGTGTVQSVAATVPAFLSVAGSPITTTGTLAISLSGTALPVANGGTGITSFGTGVATALGVNVGTAGAFVVNGGALGTPSSGTVTNLTGTASININGTVGATTPGTGAFTSLTASTTLGVTGVSTLTGGAVVQGLTVGLGAGAVATNTAVGASAIAATATGANNTALGFESGNAITSGANNTLLGYRAGKAVTTASGNAVLGDNALLVSTGGGFNVAVGNSALQNNTASENVAIGSGAATANTSGTYNVAVGRQALALNTTASNNTAVGYQAGYTNITGTRAVLVGANAGKLATALDGDVHIGYAAGQTQNTGFANTLVGGRGDVSNNNGAGFSLTSGTYNTFIGGSAGSSVDSGSKNTILGNYTGNQGGLDIRTASNYIVLSDGDGNPRAYWNGANATFAGGLTGGTSGTAYSFSGSAPATSLTLDASGRLLVGTTSGSGATMFTVNQPASSTDAKTIVSVATGTNAAYTAFVNTTVTTVGTENSSGGSLVSGSSAYSTVIANNGAYPISFGTNNTERARIDSSGNLLVGTASNANAYRQVLSFPGATTGGLDFLDTFSSAGTTVACNFRRDGTSVGSIATTLSATAYNTSSDYRLKNTIAPMTGALAKVALLKPVTYKWNVDGSDGEGFIAHELAEVVPHTVTGEKDAVNDDGSIKPQGIDTSFLVATLTAAIQEQQALITQLTARITALETA